ncbi:MAG TPA: hypothetical protein PKW35_18815 [Nannocystaceae bacterium]|nr:hypothetical protein [Nannocystaceae bacterium]
MQRLATLPPPMAAEPSAAARPRISFFVDGAALDEACARIGEPVASVVDLDQLARRLVHWLGGDLAAIHLLPAGPTTTRRSYQRLVQSQGVRIEPEEVTCDPGATLLVGHVAGAFDQAIVLTDGVAKLLARSPLLRGLAARRSRGRRLQIHVVTPPGTDAEPATPWPFVDLGELKPAFLRRCRHPLPPRLSDEKSAPLGAI